MAFYPRRKRVGKKGVKRRMVRRRRMISRKTEMSWASDKQTLQLSDDPVNAVFRLDDVNLSNFDRMVQIARAYQYFRLTKIEYKIKPFADTFFNTPGSGNTGSVPYLYYVINKSDTLNVAINGFDGLRDAGAKPIRLDDKSRTIVWRPTVAQGVPLSESNITTNFASYRTSPWLSTNANAGLPGGITTWTPSTVPHMGLLYGVKQDFINPDAVLSYGVENTAHFQFKKPLIYTVGPQDPPAPKKELTPKPDPVIA